jgi:hypothetical protein
MSDHSETESSAESGPFNIIVDVLCCNRFFNNFFHWEGSISGWVEVSGPWVEGSLSGSPVFNFSNLNKIWLTLLFLSDSLTLTICPKEGTTLMLMLLHETRITHLKRLSFGMTSVSLIYCTIKCYCVRYFINNTYPHHCFCTYLRGWVERNFSTTYIVTCFLASWWSAMNFWTTLINSFLTSPVNIFPLPYRSPISSNLLSSSKKNLRYW